MTTDPTEWVEDHFIAGDAALDFANTVFRRWPELGADLLTDTEALGAWLAHTDVLVEGEDPAVTTAMLGKARALRVDLWQVFDSQRDGRPIPADALAALLEAAQRGGAHVAVNAKGATHATDTEGALPVLALRALALVLDPPKQGVRACDRCGWFFIDSSRGRRRRWCSMKTCGNQAKAARFRSTHD